MRFDITSGKIIPAIAVSNDDFISRCTLSAVSSELVRLFHSIDKSRPLAEVHRTVFVHYVSSSYFEGYAGGFVIRSLHFRTILAMLCTKMSIQQASAP